MPKTIQGRKSNVKNSLAIKSKKISTPWLKNALKSIGSSSMEVFSDISPNIYDIVTSSTKGVNELAKSVRNGGKNVTMTTALKNNRYVKAAMNAVQYSIEDLKSGNFNNEDRLNDKMMEQFMGDGWDNFDPDTMFDSWDEDDSSTNVQFNNFATADSGGMSIAIDEGFRSSTEANLKGHKANIDTMVAISSAQMLQQQELNNQIISHLGNISNTMASIAEFNNSTLTSFIESATAFMESMGKKEDDDYSYGSDKTDPSSIYRGSNGGINVGNYKNLVMENLKSTFKNSQIGLLDDLLSGNMDMLVSNPLGWLSKLAISQITPKTLKKSMEQLDEAVAGFIPTILARIADEGDGFSFGFKDGIMKTVARIFGVKMKRTKEFDLENKITDKEATFDQITRHAIVEVIPKHLREQSAYLKAIAEQMGVDTKRAENDSKVFNYQQGRYRKLGEIKEDIYGDIRGSVTYRMGSSKFGSKLQEFMPSGNQKDTDMYNNMLEDFFVALERHGKFIDPTNLKKDSKMDKIIESLDYSDNNKNYLRAAIKKSVANPDIALNANAAIQQAVIARNNTIKQMVDDPTAYNMWALDLDKSVDGGMKEHFKQQKKEKNSISSARNTNTTRGNTGGINNILSDIRLLLNRGINVHVLKGSAFEDLDKSRDREARMNVRAEQKQQKAVDKAVRRHERKLKRQGKDEEGKSIFEGKDKTPDQWEEFMNGDSFSFYREHEEPEHQVVTRIKNAMQALAFGNGAEMFAQLTMILGDKVSALGKMLDEEFWTPMKHSLFGMKDKDGYSRDGMFSGFQNKVLDTYKKFSREFTGKGYTDSKGNKVEDKKDGEESVFGNIRKFAREVKNDIGDYILGKRLYDEKTGEYLGRDTKNGNWLGKAVGALDEGFQGWKKAIFGDEDERDTKTTLADLRDKISDALPSVATGGIGGMVFGALSGGSLLGTLIGGPIGGAVMGGIGGILSRSEKFKTWLFGDEDEDNGVISKKVQNFFKENKVPIIGGAALGAGKSLLFGGGILGSIVGGPIAGAIAGAGLALAKKSDLMQTFLYGDQDKGGWHKGVVNMFNNIFKKGDGSGDVSAGKLLGMGAIGTLGGAMTAAVVGKMGLIGAALTPFGPIGGAIAGLALSIKASKNGFREWLFGKEYIDENGNKAKKAGILQKFGNMLQVELFDPMKIGLKHFWMDTQNFIIDKIMAPVEFALEPLATGIKHIVDGVSNRIHKFLSAVGGTIKKFAVDPIVKTVRDFIVKPIRKTFGFLFKGITGIAKTIIAAPFQGLALATNFMDARNKKKSREQVMEENRQRGLKGFADNMKIRFRIGSAREDANYAHLDYDDRDDRIARYKEEKETRLARTKEIKARDKRWVKNRQLMADVTGNQLVEDTEENRIVAQRMYDAQHPYKIFGRKLKFKGEATDVKTKPLTNDEVVRNADDPKAGVEHRILGQIIKILDLLKGKKSKKVKNNQDESNKPEETEAPNTIETLSDDDDASDYESRKARAEQDSASRHARANEEKKRDRKRLRNRMRRMQPNGLQTNPEDQSENQDGRTLMDMLMDMPDDIANGWNGSNLKSTLEGLKAGKIADKLKRFNLPGFAEGGETPGGPVVVGEEGPEVAMLPQGTNVVPNDKEINVNIQNISGPAKTFFGQQTNQISNTIETSQPKPETESNTIESIGDLAKENEKAYEEAKKKGSYTEQDKLRKMQKKEEEEQAYRNHLLNSVDDIKTNHKSFKDLWASIFSKKGLITAALLMLIPALWRLIKNGIPGIPGAIGEFINEHAQQIAHDYEFGNDNLKNDQTTADAINENINEAHELLQTGDVMNWIAPDGELDSMSGAKTNFLMHVPGMAVKAVKNSGILGFGKDLLHGGKALVGGALKAGINGVQKVKGAVNFAKDAFTLSKNYGGVRNAANAVKSFKTGGLGASTWKEAANMAADNVGVTLKSGADDVGELVVKNADDALGVAKGALKKLVGKLGEVISKFGGKVGEKLPKFADDILKALGTQSVKFAKGLAAITAKVAAKAATVIGFVFSNVGMMTLGAINGATGPARLFRVNPDYVDGWMTAISSCIGGLAGTDPGAVLDLINEIVCDVTGLDIFHEIACIAYHIIAGDQKYQKLLEGKTEFEGQYMKAKEAELLPQYYNFIAENHLDENEFTFDDYVANIEEGNIQAETTSFATYNDQMHQTLGSKVLGATAKAWNGAKGTVKKVGNTISKAWNGAKSLGAKAVGGVKGAVNWIGEKATGAWEGAKKLGAGAVNKAKELGGKAVEGVKAAKNWVGDKAADVGAFVGDKIKAVGASLSAFKDNMINAGSGFKAGLQSITENFHNKDIDFMGYFKADVSGGVKDDNPFKGIITGALNIAKAFMLPKMIIDGVAKKIAGKIKETFSKSVSAIGTGSQNFYALTNEINQYALKGDVDALSGVKYEDVEDNPLNGLFHGLIGVNRFVNYGVAYPIKFGKFIKEKFNNLIDGIKKVSVVYTANLATISSFSSTGDTEGLGSFEPNIPDDTPITGVLRGLLSASKIINYIPAYVVKGGNFIKEKFLAVVNGIKQVGSAFGTNTTAMADLAMQGDTEGLGAYEITIPEGTPISGAINAVLHGIKFIDYVPAYMAKAGLFIKEKFLSLVNGVKQVGSAFGTNNTAMASMAMQGDTEGLSSYQISIPEGTPISGAINAVLHGIKFIDYVPAYLAKGGKFIKEKFLAVVNGIKQVGSAFGTNTTAMADLAMQGDTEGLGAYEISIPEDTPLSGLIGGILHGVKFIDYIPAYLAKGGMFIKEKFNAVVDATKALAETLYTNTKSYFDIADTGDLESLAAASTQAPEGTPLSPIVHGILAASKLVAYVPGAIHFVGNRIKEKFNEIVDGIKGFGASIKENHNTMVGFMNSGDLAGLTAFKPTSDENKGPLDWLVGTIAGIERAPMSIIAGIKMFGLMIKESIHKGMSGIKDLGPSIKNYISKANEYTDPKKDISTFSSLKLNDSDDPVSTIIGSILGKVMKTYVDIVRGFKSIGDAIFGKLKDAGDWVKDKVDNIGETVNDIGTKAMNAGRGGSGGRGGRSSKKPARGGRGGGRGVDLPYFSQNDPRWKSTSYGDETIGEAGCGPDAMAMVVGGLNDRTMNPVKMAKYAKDRGYRDETGTNWNFVDSAAKDHNLETNKQFKPNAGFIQSELKQGRPVILSGQSQEDIVSPFTSEGHYVVATGLDDNGGVEIQDPRGMSKSGSYNLEDVATTSNVGWSFTNRGGRGKRRRRTIKPLPINRGGRGFDDVVLGKVESSSGKKSVSSTSNDPDMLNNFPFLLQGDGRWGSHPYTSTGNPEQTIASSGCGTTSMAMVLRSYGVGVSPIDTADWSKAHGYRTANQGTAWGFFPAIANQYGLTCNELGKNGSAISQALDNGFPVIASMGPPTFTTGGHFIVLCGKDTNGNIVVNDPASKDRSQRSWPLSVFLNEGKNFWAFSKNGKGSIGALIDAGTLNLASTGATKTEVKTTKDGAPTGPLSILANFFTQFASKAWDGLLTGKWDANYEWDSNSSSDVATGSITNSDGVSIAAMNVDPGDVEKSTWKYFRSQGFTKEATAGVMGNIYQESKFQPAMIQDNGKGPAAGLFQWENYNTKDARWKNLSDFATQRGKEWTDLGTQLDHAMNEMTNTETWMWKSSKSGVNAGGLEGLKQMTDIARATQAFEGHFERAGTPMMDTRISAAKGYYEQFKDENFGDDTDNKTKNALEVNNAGFNTSALTDVSAGMRVGSFADNVANSLSLPTSGGTNNKTITSTTTSTSSQNGESVPDSVAKSFTDTSKSTPETPKAGETWADVVSRSMNDADKLPSSPFSGKGGGRGGEDNGFSNTVEGPSTRFAQINPDFEESTQSTNIVSGLFDKKERISPQHVSDVLGVGGGRGSNDKVIVDLLHAITGFLEKISDSTMSSDQKLNMLKNIQSSSQQINVINGGKGETKTKLQPIIIGGRNEQIVSKTDRNTDIAKRLAKGF